MRGSVSASFGRASKVTVAHPAASAPDTLISPSPMAACMSPQPKSAPSVYTGKYSVAPAVMAVLSILPPWEPGVPQLTGSPAGATPITPIMGLSGMRSSSSHTSSSPSILQRCVLQASKRSPHTPSPSPVQEAVCPSNSMASMVTFSAPPGTAPSTKIGPVAGLM